MHTVLQQALTRRQVRFGPAIRPVPHLAFLVGDDQHDIGFFW
jgi:hypothetical protein